MRDSDDEVPAERELVARRRRTYGTSRAGGEVEDDDLSFSRVRRSAANDRRGDAVPLGSGTDQSTVSTEMSQPSAVSSRAMFDARRPETCGSGG